MVPIDERDAKWLRILRVDLECSHARIGELWEMRFGQSFGFCAGDSGRQLCTWAAALLGEDADSSEWN